MSPRIRKLPRARVGAVAKGLFKKAGPKLRRAKSLPSRGVRPPKRPSTVQRLPSGRYPANSRWAGKIYRGSAWTPALASKYPDGVRFTRAGYPDFKPYAKKTYVFENGFGASREADIALANKVMGAERGYTWHHVEDGHTLLLVPTDLHSAIRHAGGIALK